MPWKYRPVKITGRTEHGKPVKRYWTGTDPKTGEKSYSDFFVSDRPVSDGVLKQAAGLAEGFSTLLDKYDTALIVYGDDEEAVFSLEDDFELRPQGGSLASILYGGLLVGTLVKE
jgi:hypothetical protein